jgi:GxxExxY protein
VGEIRLEYFPFKDETETIIYFANEVHNSLGSGFLEIVYKDALELEFEENAICYEREKEFTIKYKEVVLNRKFHADFIMFDAVIVEVKAKQTIGNEDTAQLLNYLKCSECEVGLLLNFGRSKLEIKRMVF